MTTREEDRVRLSSPNTTPANSSQPPQSSSVRLPGLSGSIRNGPISIMDPSNDEHPGPSVQGGGWEGSRSVSHSVVWHAPREEASERASSPPLNQKISRCLPALRRGFTSIKLHARSQRVVSLASRAGPGESSAADGRARWGSPSSTRRDWLVVLGPPSTSWVPWVDAGPDYEPSRRSRAVMLALARGIPEGAELSL